MCVNIGGVDTLADAWLAWLPFVLGWSIGWALLARPRALTSVTERTESVAVVVPARNEAHALPVLLPSVAAQLRSDDELIVVDDGSSDATAAVAREFGARVIGVDAPPAGWAGKPNACWTGAEVASTDLIVFVDADVTAGAGLLDGLAAAVRETPEALVSVQPWHRPGSVVEQLGLFGNLAALMGVGRFSIGRRYASRPVAFGPVLAMRLERYRACGGHGAGEVRGSLVEDVALARCVGRSEVFTGRPHAGFRMYPGGWSELATGWTRVLATGIGASPAWATVGVALWLWAVASAPFVSGLAVAVTVLQLAVLSRVAGRFSPLAILLYPVPLVVFVALALRSVWVRLRGGRVRWKGRRIAVR